MQTQEQRQANMAKAREVRLANIAATKSVQPIAPAEIPAENEAGVSFETRQPFGSFVQKLAAPPIPGMHLHWFNDEPGRIDTAKAAGYTHVLDAAGKNRSRVVDKTTGMLGYLMKTPQEWYEHDMAQQQETIDGFEEAIRRGADENGQPGKDGRYIPKQGISIRTNRR